MAELGWYDKALEKKTMHRQKSIWRKLLKKEK